MSCNTSTPAQAVCVGGCCAGGGCGIPPSFSNACSGFTGSGLSGACQTAMGACGPQVQSALSGLPGCCSGIASGQLGSALSGAGLNPNNLVGSCLEQAQSLFQNGIPGITNIMQSAQAFCQNSFDVKGIIAQCTNLNLPGGDLGFNLDSIKNACTGGLTAQFGSLASEGFKDLCSNLGNLGTLVDPAKLSECLNPGGLINSVVNQGFGKEMLEQLEKVGINSLSEVVGANEKLLMQALESVPKDVVGAIVEKTGFQTLGASLNNLAEVITQPVKYLGEKANELIGGSVATLQEKLSTVVGAETSILTMGSLGQTLSKIVEPVTTIMDQANNNLAAWEGQFPTESQLNGLAGSGTGIFGNPKISDVIGVAAGIGFTAKILDMTTRQNKILQTSEGIALQQAINSAIADPANDSANADAIAAAAQAFINPTNPIIRDEIAAGQQSFNDVANKILLEKANMAAAGIVPADSRGTISDIVAWVSNLHYVHDDPSQLGYADYIREISDSSVTGEAIRAAIDEGKNLAIYRNLGINPPTTLSALAYSQQLLNTAANNELALNCCPAGRVSNYGIG